MTLRASIVSLCLTLLVAAAATGAVQPPPGFVHGEQWPGTGTHPFTWPAPEGWITVLEEVDFGSNAAAPEFQGKWLYHYTVTNRITSPIDQWGFLDPLDGGPILAYGSSVLNTEWGFDDTGNIPVWTAGVPIPEDGAGSFWFVSAGPPDRLDYRAFAKDGDLVVEGLTSGPTGEDFVTFTYTPGGWGAKPRGENPGTVLHNNFDSVYPVPPFPAPPNGPLVIGGDYTITFTEAQAITDFLPSGGKPGVLEQDYTDPDKKTEAGEFASQVLALQLNVDFSNAGVLPDHLADWHLDSGPLMSNTVAEVLASANIVLGGGQPSEDELAALGLTVSELNDVLAYINEKFVP